MTQNGENFAMLDALCDACNDLDALAEQASVPGKESVLAAIREARRCLGKATICEDGRIKDHLTGRTHR